MSKVAACLIALAVVAIGIFAAVQHSFAADQTMPQAGQTAPTFTLPNEDGKPVSLASMRGKWVVLYFYPKDMSSGCTIEAHNFQRDSSKYRKENADVVGVSVDSVSSHKEFCAKDSLGFTLLSDHDKKVSAEYGSLGTFMGMKMSKRNTFLINPEGKIVKVWTKVDPNDHSQEVLATLQNMEKPGM